MTRTAGEAAPALPAHDFLPPWTWAVPLVGWAVLVAGWSASTAWLLPLQVIALGAAVIASVHHAEVVAARVGEPFGTLVLAVAVTAIEVALILSLMLGTGAGNPGLARDTVFAAVMIILTGMVGICLLVGGQRHHEQRFSQNGVNAALATLAAIVVLTLVLPNFTTSVAGPYYAPSQLVFIAIVALVLYLTFIFVQTIRHRDYFLPEDAREHRNSHERPPSNAQTALATGLLLACLGAVVLLAKSLSPATEAFLVGLGAPKAVMGVLIAAIVLLPESVAAVRAAQANRLQTSLNLALGSALASIGLTIPAVALLSLWIPVPLALGIDGKSMVLLLLALIVATLSLGTGRTTVLQGVVHLVIFAVYLFTTFVP